MFRAPESKVLGSARLGFGAGALGFDAGIVIRVLMQLRVITVIVIRLMDKILHYPL